MPCSELGCGTVEATPRAACPGRRARWEGTRDYVSSHAGMCGAPTTPISLSRQWGGGLVASREGDERGPGARARVRAPYPKALFQYGSASVAEETGPLCHADRMKDPHFFLLLSLGFFFIF